MPSTRDIKKRIKSVTNTAQITKAMEAVSATKMRKSQEFALRARPFAVAALQMLRNILDRTTALPALLTPRQTSRFLLIAITSDKGLAGAYNANILRKMEGWIAARKAAYESYDVVTIGKKAREYCLYHRLTPKESFTGFGDYSQLQDTLPVGRIAVEGFLNGTWGQIDIIYTQFRTTLYQRVAAITVLPATQERIERIVREIIPEHGRYAEKSSSTLHSLSSTLYQYEYKYEPSPEEILNALIPQLLFMQIHHIILESNASEHSARMVAMKNASDSASDLIRNLTLQFNKARQAGITRELTEITAGKEALES